MKPEEPRSIQAALLRHWPRFAPVWLFPVFLYLTSFLPGFREYATGYVLFAAGCFAAYSLWAAKAARRGGITKLHEIVLLAILPFVIWCTTVLVFWIGVRTIG